MGAFCAIYLGGSMVADPYYVAAVLEMGALAGATDLHYQSTQHIQVKVCDQKRDMSPVSSIAIAHCPLPIAQWRIRLWRLNCSNGDVSSSSHWILLSGQGLLGLGARARFPRTSNFKPTKTQTTTSHMGHARQL